MLSIKKLFTKILALLKTMNTVESSNVTLPSGFTNNGAARNFYYRKGTTCMVGFDCTPSARVNQVTLCTLPTACCPVRALRYSTFVGVNRSNEDGGDHYVIINTDGTVQYTGKGRLWQTFTFICNGD